MSDTPRTDAAILHHVWKVSDYYPDSTDVYYQTILCNPRGGDGETEVVSVKFARQLERELADMTTRRDLLSSTVAEVTAQRDAMWSALKWLCWDDCPHCCGSFEKCPRYQDVIKSEDINQQP